MLKLSQHFGVCDPHPPPALLTLKMVTAMYVVTEDVIQYTTHKLYTLYMYTQ
jgi:hypothetical protein